MNEQKNKDSVISAETVNNSSKAVNELKARFVKGIGGLTLRSVMNIPEFSGFIDSDDKDAQAEGITATFAIENMSLSLHQKLKNKAKEQLNTLVKCETSDDDDDMPVIDLKPETKETVDINSAFAESPMLMVTFNENEADALAMGGFYSAGAGFVSLRITLDREQAEKVLRIFSDDLRHTQVSLENLSSAMHLHTADKF